MAKARKPHQTFPRAQATRGEHAPVPKRSSAEGLSPYIVESIKQRRRTQELEQKQLQAIEEAAKAAGVEPTAGASLLEMARRDRVERAYKRRRYLRQTLERTRLTGASTETIDRDRLLQERTCYLCGEEIPKGEGHLDHVIPISRGGSHTADNLRATHGYCNLRKGTRTAEEYMESIRTV